jgi:pyruvate formate lyase activating enzyme
LEQYDGEVSGIIRDIGHGTLRDGPGWRSIIYFKGCNFKCPWCGSPDTMSREPEPMFYPERVKYAERLVASCPLGAFSAGDSGVVLNRELCIGCETLACAGACIDGSVEAAGRAATVQQLVDEVLEYRRAHRNYGVTLSGGEPTLQWEFFIELLKAFKHHGLHTAVETNGSNARLPVSFEFLDLVICDLKHAGFEEHKRLTGQSNSVVERNIRAAAHSGKPLWVRLPVVPGINDGANIDAAMRMLSPLKDLLEIELLGYHCLGTYKWNALGKTYGLEHVAPPDARAIAELEKKFVDAGFRLVKG